MGDIFDEVEQDMKLSRKPVWRSFWVVFVIVVLVNVAFWATIITVFGPYAMRILDASTRAIENVAEQTEPGQ